MQTERTQPPLAATPGAPRARLLLDYSSLIVVLAAALAVRLVLLNPAPPIFLTTDSITYALPAVQLAHGEGFDLSLRRTPGYPLFVAVWLAAFGDDFRALLVVQHLLGLATAGLTWLLGRTLFGPLAGLLGGLAVALSGPQLVYEHYLMTEPLFTLLLVAGLLALAAAVRRASAGLLLLTGLLFGLAALTRPIGQALPALVPLAVLLRGRWGGPWRPRLLLAARAGLIGLVGFGLVTLPWMVRNRVVGGELTGSAALGKTLFGRITRHDDGFRFDLPPAGPAERDPRRAEARALARQAAREDTSRGSLVHEQLRREFGYTEAQAYNVMRDVALEVILAQPEYYLRSSLAGTIELFLGQEEPLRLHLERLTNNRLRQEWQQEPALAPLLPSPVSPEDRGRRFGLATNVVRLYEPSGKPAGPLLGLLFLTGTAAILLRPSWRAGLALPAIVLGVLSLSAFLDGPVPRFRYPLDPLIAVVAAAGLVAVLDGARATWRAVGRRSAGAAQLAPAAEPPGRPVTAQLAQRPGGRSSE